MEIIKEQEFTFNGKKIVVLRLINNNGIELVASNYGATILSVLVPQPDGSKMDITLSYDTIEDYISHHESPEKYYFGCTVGRYANRIANGAFKINDTNYQLSKNDGDNHLHGGLKGLNKTIWNYEVSDVKTKVVFYTCCKEFEEGYPGNLNIDLELILNDDNEIRLNYTATTDKPTPVNLTNHMYFNLNGGKNTILNHSVELKSKHILETGSNKIPTGKLLPIEGTDFDFLKPRLLGQSEQMKKGGFDHTFVIDNHNKTLVQLGRIYEPSNNISIDIFSTEPSVQMYTANSFDGSFKGKAGQNYSQFHGLCIETQQFPDSPNHANFPNTILNPEDEYKQETIYKIQFNDNKP